MGRGCALRRERRGPSDVTETSSSKTAASEGLGTDDSMIPDSDMRGQAVSAAADMLTTCIEAGCWLWTAICKNKMLMPEMTRRLVQL